MSGITKSGAASRPPRFSPRKGLAVGLCAGLVLLAACGGNKATGGTASSGGTLTFLTQSAQILHLDPQRNYTGEDLAFASGYLHRTLTAYKISSNSDSAGQIVPDLATDTGTSSDGGRVWKFTLRDGVKWENGQPVTCADVKYGVSRTFATSVITDGPTYAISLLDIPSAKDGSSVYKGPYVTTGNDQAAYDKAVSCSGPTITFRLKQPQGDFNYTVTLLSFSPVPQAFDSGEKYDDRPLSNGPYKILSYKKKTKLVLVRNPDWSSSTDSYRPAYPDRIEYLFGIQDAIITERLIADAGDDQRSLSPDSIDSAKLASVFGDSRLKDRRFNELDPYVRYYAINTTKVPELKHRQAILAAVDRAQLRKIAGGTYAGDYADGVVKPNLALDYSPTGLWDTLLGKAIPPEGDAAYAKTLIKESGKPFPNPITIDYPKSPENDKAAASLVASLAKAGIIAKPNGLELGSYYGIVLDPAKQGAMSAAGWGPDWLNASTVIPELFTPAGGFNLSRYDNAAFTKACQDARALTDRTAQAKKWQELDKQAAGAALVLPTRFGREQRLVGSKVVGAYIWSPYGSWPYAVLAVAK
jgi:peptide/nickel transport system substrate-binding protein